MSEPDGPEPRRRGRPPSAAKHRAILAAATERFVRDGYRETTVDAVAAAAGVSKQTVYSRFGDKEALFLAVIAHVRESTGSITAELRTPNLTGADKRTWLAGFGEDVLAASMAPPVAALRRVMIAELGRHPQLQALWTRDQPSRAAALFAERVCELQAAGELDVPDVATAVGQFFALLGHPANQRTLYGSLPLTDQDRRQIAASATDMFLRAYAAGRSGGGSPGDVERRLDPNTPPP